MDPETWIENQDISRLLGFNTCYKWGDSNGSSNKHRDIMGIFNSEIFMGFVRQTPGIESRLVTPVISVGAMFVCDWGCNPLTNWVRHQYAINGDLLGIRVGYFRGRLDSLDGV